MGTRTRTMAGELGLFCVTITKDVAFRRWAAEGSWKAVMEWPKPGSKPASSRIRLKSRAVTSLSAVFQAKPALK